MAGTQKLVEQAINWVCATRLPVGADVSNCVAGIDIRNLSTRSTVYCRENELGVTPPIYRWFPESLAVADGLTVILPITLSPAQPGRWRVESAAPPPSDCCTAAETPYDDGLVPPPLGVGTVQGAIDILKVVSVNLAADVVIAQNTANAAGAAAAAAQTSANTAITNAATAQTAANNAQTTANAAGLAAAAAQTTANNAQTDATAALAGLGTKADKSITLTAGAGMTGGGDLSANRTFDVGQNADGSVVVNANDIQVAAAIQSGAAAGATAVQPARTITAGNGLTGGGDLSSDRTLSVQAADASIAVAAGGVSVGVLQTDAQHGNRGGGALHADVVAAGASGFMTGADKTKLNGITAGAAVASVTGTAPIVSSGGTTPALSITAATPGAAGSMSAADKTKLDNLLIPLRFGATSTGVSNTRFLRDSMTAAVISTDVNRIILPRPGILRVFLVRGFVAGTDSAGTVTWTWRVLVGGVATGITCAGLNTSTALCSDMVNNIVTAANAEVSIDQTFAGGTPSAGLGPLSVTIGFEPT